MATVADYVQIRAFAKLNLTLEVLGQREDNYHELRSVVQTISLHDEMSLRTNTVGTKLRLRGYPVPQGDDNLAMTAIRQAESRLGLSRDVELLLVKHIPPGRGLGGGSSDAAAILRALGCIYEQRLPMEQGLALAAELGSDVPLFLRGGTVLMSGRGEHLQHMEQSRRPDYDYTMALAWPDISVPTEGAYAMLTPEDYGDGSASEVLWGELQQGKQPRPDQLANCFERVVFQQWPAVARLQERMTELAEVAARLTGSGSSIFAITPEAQRVVAILREEGYEAQVVHPVPQGHLLSCSASLWEGDN